MVMLSMTSRDPMMSLGNVMQHSYCVAYQLVKYEYSSSRIYVPCRVQLKYRLLLMITQAPCRCQIRWYQVARIQPPVRNLQQVIIINPAVGQGSRMKLLAVGILTLISHISCLTLTVKVIRYILSLVFVYFRECTNMRYLLYLSSMVKILTYIITCVRCVIRASWQHNQRHWSPYSGERWK